MQSGGGDGRSRFNGDFAATLAGARANPPAAWNDLYAWLAPGVAGYLRMLGASEVEDLTCDVLLAVFRRTHSFQGSEANFRSWVFTVAHSRLIDERRRRGRQPSCVPIRPISSRPTDGVPDRGRGDAIVRGHRHRSGVRAVAARPAAVVLLRIIGELTIDKSP